MGQFLRGVTFWNTCMPQCQNFKKTENWQGIVGRWWKLETFQCNIPTSDPTSDPQVHPNSSFHPVLFLFGLFLHMLLWCMGQLLPTSGNTSAAVQTGLFTLYFYDLSFPQPQVLPSCSKPVYFASYPFIMQHGASTWWLENKTLPYEKSRTGALYMTTNTVWKGFNSIHLKNYITWVPLSLLNIILWWHNWCIKLEIAIIVLQRCQI